MRKMYVVLFTILLLLSISLFGCGGGGSSSTTSSLPYIEALLFSFAGSTPANLPNAMVVVTNSSGAAITNATVVMNGVTLTYNSSVNHQQYEGIVSVAPGGSITLSVTAGGNTYTASGAQFAVYPTITFPLANATITAGSTNTVNWSPGSPLTTNTAYLLGVLDSADPIGGATYFQGLTTSFNSYTIPVNSLTVGSRILIVGITTPVSIPNAAAGSYFVFGGFNYIPITVSP